MQLVAPVFDSTVFQNSQFSTVRRNGCVRALVGKVNKNCAPFSDSKLHFDLFGSSALVQVICIPVMLLAKPLLIMQARKQANVSVAPTDALHQFP